MPPPPPVSHVQTIQESSSSSSGSESSAEEPRCVLPRFLASFDCSSKASKEHAAREVDRRLNQEVLETNHIIHKSFDKFANVAKEDGRRAVTLERASKIGPDLAARLKLPAVIFANVPQVAPRFDFDETGLLDKVQCTTMFRGILRERRKEWSDLPELEVPRAMVKERGYILDKELGRGGQGVMYLASKKGEDQPYCIKFYSKGDASQDDETLHDLIKEYTLMKTLNSDHVAKTYEVFHDNDHFYLVNEPYFGGDMTRLAKQAHNAGVALTENWWRQIFRQSLEGIRYLHSQAIMHCDIKEENIMIAKDGDWHRPHIVLIDFGLAEAFSKTNKGDQSGTPGYIPPETWLESRWYPRGDIFSMGVVIFQQMIGEEYILQTDGDDEDDKRAALELKLPWERFPLDMPQLRALTAQMLHRNRSARPTAMLALLHQWFQSTSDAELPPHCQALLLGASAAQCTRGLVIEELAKDNDLHALRKLLQQLRDLDTSKSGSLPASMIAQLLQQQQVPKEVAEQFVQDCADERGNFKYISFMEQSIRLKERYSQQLIYDLFHELDEDGSGALEKDELAQLMKSDYFTVHFEGVDELLRYMDTNSDGLVSFNEFKVVMLRDGRIARREDGAQGDSSNPGSACTLS